jgi:hypothetical protein
MKKKHRWYFSEVKITCGKKHRTIGSDELSHRPERKKESKGSTAEKKES